MTAPVDIANRALAEIGAQAIITDLTEDSNPAAYCRMNYEPLRQQLLRAAPWAFARKTVELTQLGLITDTPSGSIYPFYAKYLYPPDCLKLRYILPPLSLPAASSVSPAPDVSNGPLWPAYAWCGPSRAWRFLVSYEASADIPQRRVILSNVPNALAVYTVDVTDPDMFDPLFENALVMLLADKLVIPLSGNVGMKQSFTQLARDAVLQARVQDGNEAITFSDPTPTDWIATRMVDGGVGWQGGNAGLGGGWGNWYDGWDSSGWSM